MDFDADDVQAGAGEEINHIAGPAGGKRKFSGLISTSVRCGFSPGG